MDVIREVLDVLLDVPNPGIELLKAVRLVLHPCLNEEGGGKAVDSGRKGSGEEVARQ